MATIKFFLQSEQNPAGIYVRLRHGVKIDAKAKTNFAINPNDWSPSKQQTKTTKDEKFKELNENLSNLRSSLLTHYNNKVNKERIDSQWLKDFINPPVKGEVIPSRLIDYFDFYSLHKKSSLKPSSQTKLNVNKHWIERFQKATKREYYVKDVNDDFKLKFERFGLSENYNVNTIARALKFIKTICYHAKSKGVETHVELESISMKYEKVKKIFLNPSEIVKIEKQVLKEDYLINARDWLIISCETGQRVSDFLKFNKNQIRTETTTKNGKTYYVPLIEFNQVKTNKKVAVPLSKKVLEILKKRNEEFPRKLSSQHYNEYIKKVCKEAGLIELTEGGKINPATKKKEKGFYPKYELVTSHIGRRSFATNNYGKIPTPLLMSATAHGTEKTFLEYIGKSDTEMAKLLAEYFI